MRCGWQCDRRPRAGGRQPGAWNRLAHGRQGRSRHGDAASDRKAAFASFPIMPGRPARSSRSIRRSPRMVSRSNGDVSMAGEIVQFNPATMAAPGGHYSHSISANGFVFVSGQLPIAPDGTKLNEAPFEQQAQQVLDNVAHALKAAGSSIAGLTQVRVYVTDIEAWPAFNTLYAAWAGAFLPTEASGAVRRRKWTTRPGPAQRVRRGRWCRCPSCTTGSRSRSKPSPSKRGPERNHRQIESWIATPAFLGHMILPEKSATFRDHAPSCLRRSPPRRACCASPCGRARATAQRAPGARRTPRAAPPRSGAGRRWSSCRST